MEMSAKPQEECGSIRVVVVQSRDFSSILRTLMALKAVKQLYPKIEITFVCRDRFSEPVRKVSWIDNVKSIPVDQFVDPVIKEGVTEKKMLGAMAIWLRPLIENPWDIFVDWSFDEVGSYLSALIPAYVKLGFSRNSNNGLICADDWSQYIQAIVQTEINQDIHITDIMTTQLLTALQVNYGPPANENQDKAVTESEFFNVKVEGNLFNRLDRTTDKKWVVIHLGASDEGWCWSNSNWADLVETVLHRHPDHGVIVLGGQSYENFHALVSGTSLSEFKASGRLQLLIGEVTFDEWVFALNLGSALISSDSAAIHLASILGVRALCLNATQERNFVKGPYGNGHVVLVGENLSVNSVYHTWKNAILDWSRSESARLIEHLKDALTESEAATIQIFKSRIRPVDDGGGVVFEDIEKKSITYKEWISKVNSHIARVWFCGWAPNVEQELEQSRIDFRLLKELREIKDPVYQVCELMTKCVDVASDLATLSEISSDSQVMSVERKDKVQRLGGELSKADRVLDEMSSKFPILRVLSQSSRVMMHNLHGDELLDISLESLKAYKRLSDGAFVIKEWVDKTFYIAKPKPISKREFGKDGGLVR